MVYTINNNGDNGNSTVDLSTGGHVTLTSEQGAAATQVWAGPIKLGSHTTCTGTKNQMGAPEGYHQYNCTDGRMEFTFNAGGGTTDPDPEPTSCTVSGTVTSYGDADETVTLQLIQKGHTEAAYEATVTGNSAAYTMADVTPSTYTLRVEKKGHATFTKEITVTDSNVTEDVTIYLIGDVNLDGTISAADMQRLYNHLNGTAPLTDRSTADVNNDGFISASDMQRLYNHLNGTLPLN